MIKRRHYGTITCDVEVDIAEAIAELSDDEIKDECSLRGIATGCAADSDNEGWRDFADEMRHVMASGDRLHQEVLIIRMLVMAGVPRLKIKVAA